MTNQIRNPNVEGNGRLALGSDFEHSGFFRHSTFVIRISVRSPSFHFNRLPIRVSGRFVRHQYPLIQAQRHCLARKAAQIDSHFLPFATPVSVAVDDALEHLCVVRVNVQLPRAAGINAGLKPERRVSAELQRAAQHQAAHLIAGIGCEHGAVEISDAADAAHATARAAKPRAFQFPIRVPIPYQVGQLEKLGCRIGIEILSAPILPPFAAMIFSPTAVVRFANSEMLSFTGGVSATGPILSPTMRSPNWSTRSLGRHLMPCIAPTTDAALAALQSASVKSAACAARFTVFKKSPPPNQTLTRASSRSEQLTQGAGGTVSMITK